MTVEAFVPSELYTVSGTGPYAITHAYRAAEDIRVSVVMGLDLAPLPAGAFTVTPSGPANGGIVTLTSAVATANAGRTLRIDRATATEQGFVGATSREKGVERQLDAMVMAIQENAERGARALVIQRGNGVTPEIPAIDPDHTIIATADGGFEQGPSRGDIEAAAGNAAQATASASAASASAVSAAASSAAAGAASGRLEIVSFAQLANDFVYDTPNPDQKIAAAGDVIINRKENIAYLVLLSNASDAHLDYTGSGGVKLHVLTNSILAWGIPSDGTAADMAVVDAAYAAASGKTLRYPNGSYNFSRAPAGLNTVHAIGDPFTIFPNTVVPLFNGVFTGNKEIAVVAAVLRYYAAGDVSSGSAAGWYLLQAKSGQFHDPVLLGPVTASGAGSVILDIDFEEFGIDPNVWTPSGFVCGPDEGLAANGAIFGASVGTTGLTVMGSYTGEEPRSFIQWNGSAFVGTNAPYTFNWVSGVTAYLELTRNASAKKSQIGPFPMPMVTANIQNGGTYFDVKTGGGLTNDRFRITFWGADGINLNTPTTDWQFTIADPAIKPRQFNFATDPGAGSNIWMVGVFTRKSTQYPEG